jgi:hypothetical protein
MDFSGRVVTGGAVWARAEEVFAWLGRMQRREEEVGVDQGHADDRIVCVQPGSAEATRGGRALCSGSRGGGLIRWSVDPADVRTGRTMCGC